MKKLTKKEIIGICIKEVYQQKFSFDEILGYAPQKIFIKLESDVIFCLEQNFTISSSEPAIFIEPIEVLGGGVISLIKSSKFLSQTGGLKRGLKCPIAGIYLDSEYSESSLCILLENGLMLSEDYSVFDLGVRVFAVDERFVQNLTHIKIRD